MTPRPPLRRTGAAKTKTMDTGLFDDKAMHDKAMHVPMMRSIHLVCLAGLKYISQ